MALLKYLHNEKSLPIPALYLQGMKLKKLTSSSQGFRMENGLENGAMSAMKHFSSKWSISINGSTAIKLNI